MKSEEILGKEKMWKLMLIMAAPSILAQLVNLLYSIIDRVYIGNMDIIGTQALAGLSLCTPIITIISSFSAIVAGGGAPLASRALGAKNKLKAEKYIGNGFFLLLVFSFLLTILAFIFKKDILYLIGASEDTFNYANDYLNIYLFGTIFVQIGVGLNNFISAQGKSGLAMVSTLIGAFLNIALDPLFIFVFGMGIKGAALATIISQGVSAIWILLILFNKKTSLRIKIENVVPDLKIILDIFALGVAAFVMSSTEAIIGFALNGQLKKYGGDIHVSNLAILQSCMMLISIPLSGFTNGVSPILSYSFGAKNKERLIECFKKTLILSISWCSGLALIMIFFPYPFARMFTSDQELISLAMKYLPIFIFGMLIFGTQRACQTTFVAMGESVISLFIALLRKVILLVPLTYILPMIMSPQVSGVYHAECIADITAATICGTIFFFRFRTILKKMSINQEVQSI